MRGIRAIAVLMMVFLMTASLVMTQIGADPVPKTIQGQVDPASDGALAFPGVATFYIQSRTNEGKDVDLMYQGGGVEYYFSPIEDNITDWNPGDTGVMIVDVEKGTYLGGDRAGYVAYATALLDGAGSQVFPTVTLQKIPTPTQTANGTGYINMSWPALPDPDNLIAGYKIYRSTTNDSDGSWSLVGGSVNAPLTDTWYNDSTPSDGVDYYYSVKVCFVGYSNGPVDNHQNAFFGEGSVPMQSPGAAPTVDYILIMDAPGGAGVEISDQPIDVGMTISGYAVAYNNSLGFLWDVSVTWSIVQVAANATTNPGSGTSSDFWSGWIGEVVTWQADDGAGHLDTVVFTINGPIVDSIDIVDTAGTGLTSIPNQAVDVAVIIPGYAAAFNNTLGYIGDVSVDWTVTPSAFEDATTDPGPSSMANFNSGTVGGSVTWEADYNTGQATDSITIGINAPTVDYITIVDTGGTGATEIADNTVSLSFTIQGWAASFNNSIGYLQDISVMWSVGNVGSTAFTSPLGPSLSSTFDASTLPGTATWTADDGSGHTDTVVYTIADWTVDYIEIVDTPGTGATAYGPMTVGVGVTITGYAAAFNDTGGYLGDILVNWTVVNAASNATTTPLMNSDTSDFWSGYLGGGATWTADDGNGHSDSVSITINPPTVDSIEIVDTSGTGLTPIAAMPVNVGYTMTGYAASFNNSIGYLGDVSVDWTVTPTAGEDASSLPATGTSSVFDSGTIGGSVSWMADYNTGQATDTVAITITPPTVDTIDIVDTIGIGTTAFPPLSLGVGITVTGYAAGFNATSGYIGDVTVDWTVTPSAGEDASSDPGPADTADFNSGTIGGSVTWDADYNSGQATDSVTVTIIAATVDYIDIVDQAGTGTISIPDQTLVIGATLDGYAASFNDTIGYLGDISVTWSVVPTALEDAFVTDPGPATTTTFDAGTIDGSVDWVADDGSGHSDTVTIDITLWTTDYIEIVDTAGTGATAITNQAVNVGYTITGYAAAFNNTAGYLGDVIVTWSVTPAGGEDANTAPLGGTTSDFYSGTIGGSVDWMADDGSGNTYTVTITINPPTVDYIEIVDTAGTGLNLIMDQAVGVGITVTGYAASFNTTSGYLGDLSVAWSITPSGGEDATTLPAAGTTSDFYSGTISGSVDWIADDLSSHTDTVTITIDPATIDYIDIVDTAGTGAAAIPPQSVGVGATITGYAAGFNNTLGYIMDVSVTWSVVPTAGEDASTLPLSGTTSDFYSGTIDGSVTWTANYNAGAAIDSVSITILPPTVDYIEIVDTAGTGSNLISDQLIVTLDTKWGYAAAFNNTAGYMNDVSVTWSASGAAASTFPLVGTSSQFDAGATPGMATWTADYGGGITDMVTFTITDFTVDYIEIVDTAGTGATIIGDQIVNVAFGITGYAAAFNNTGGGYLGDISVAWSVIPSGGEDASTAPGSGSSSDFDSGTIGGSVGWMADDLLGHTDTVTFTINAPTVDYIDIVSTGGTGATTIANQAVDVGDTIAGYAAGFNTSIGYLYDVSVTWSVSPLAGEDAFTAPLGPSISSTFDAGTIGGSVTWEADYNSGAATDSVTITINPPTVDYIEIVDTIGTGVTAITDFSVDVGITVTGYAAAFNNVVGYLYDVSADWTVTPAAGEDATTDPGPAIMADFMSGTIGGSVDWEADFGGMTYTITITINPPTIDYIIIVDTSGVGTTAIADQTVDIGFSATGYAASFNDTSGYLGDISVNWDVDLGSASTMPVLGLTSDFDAGLAGGTATWTADDGSGHSDTVVFTINAPTVDYIDIVDTMDTGATSLADQSVGIGVIVTGYAASFNDTAGYLGDISVSWSVVPVGTEDADTSPATGDTSDFDSGNIGGSVTWMADDLAGHTDSVVITITGAVIDYVRVMDAPGGTGSDVDTATYAVEDTDNFYLVGFNTTTGFVRDLNAVWSISPSGVGTVSTSGHETNFTALEISPTATCVVTGTDPSSALSDTTGTLTVLEPTVDYIMIMDVANNAGAEVIDETYGVHRTTDDFYAAAFNNTVDYLGDMSVAWSSDDTAVGAVVATGDPTTFTAQDVSADGTCIVTAVYQVGIEDTTGTLTVLAPTIDYIQVEDAAANAGSEVTSLTMNDDQTDDLYAAGYNDTSGYVMDVDADWTTTLGSVAPATGADMTTYTPAAGTGTLTATYNALTADVTLTVTDVTGPDTPTAPTVEEENGKAVITFPPSPPADVAEYQIQRMEGDGGTWIDVGGRQDPTTASFTDEDVEAGKTYNYRLIAYDDEGNPSTPSPTIQIKIPDKEEELPWVMLLLLIIIIIIVILLLLFLMTRKKGEEEEMPPEEEPEPMMPEEELPPEETGLGVAGVAAPPPPSAAAGAAAAPEAHMCPNCGGAMEFIEDYDQYYCYTCGKYDSEFDEEGGEGGDEMPEGEGEPEGTEGEEPSGEGPEGEGPPGEGGTEFEEKPPEY